MKQSMLLALRVSRGSRADVGYGGAGRGVSPVPSPERRP